MSRCLPLLLGVVLAMGAMTLAKADVTAADAARKEGEELAAELRSTGPVENSKVSGTLSVRKGKSTASMAIQCEVVRNNSTWQSIYRCAGPTHALPETLVVIHSENAPNQYFFAPLQTEYKSAAQTNGTNLVATPLPPALRPLTTKEVETLAFGMGQSDFSVADLGLEFFHWPVQRVVKHEMRRSRGCRVLESVNPHPVSGGYSRVVSWIDTESGGIVFAEAYDARNKLLKEFAPKDIKKVNGQWQLESMEISNRQTGSRTRIEFKL